MPARGSVVLTPLHPTLLRAVGLMCIGAYVAVLVLALERPTYNIPGVLIVGPALVLLTVPALARQARREEDRTVFWILLERSCCDSSAHSRGSTRSTSSTVGRRMPRDT